MRRRPEPSLTGDPYHAIVQDEGNGSPITRLAQLPVASAPLCWGVLLFTPGLGLSLAKQEIEVAPLALAVLERCRGVRVAPLNSDAQAPLITLLLSAQLRRGLTDHDGRDYRGLPPGVMNSHGKAARELVEGALIAAPRQRAGNRWGFVSPTYERGLALKGIMRRIGVHVQVKQSNRCLVLIASNEVEHLRASGIQIPQLPPTNSAPIPSTGTHVLDAVNADRRESLIRLSEASLRILGAECPSHLEQAARLRIEYPYLSLEALGEMMTPPVSKHVVAGRLRRLRTLAGLGDAEVRDG